MTQAFYGGFGAVNISPVDAASESCSLSSSVTKALRREAFGSATMEKPNVRVLVPRRAPLEMQAVDLASSLPADHRARMLGSFLEGHPGRRN